MQTMFTADQLRDPDTASSNQVLRTCVHCGMCTATCPTFVLLGDELDSPRGRIYLIKDMLEGGKPATEETVRHVDRCLSCLACMSTCPSGVNYMHLVDHARRYIAETYNPALARAPVARGPGAHPAPSRPLPPRHGRRAPGQAAAPPGPRPATVLGGRVRAMLDLAPPRLPPRSAMQAPQTHPAQGAKHGRVALLAGCAQTVLDPAINEATIRLLHPHGH